MFDWSRLFSKNSDLNKSNECRVFYNEEAKNIIEKWMKINGIEGISFDEYISQLGLDYLDIVNIDSISLNLSDPIWKDENFMGALYFKSKPTYSGYEEKFDLSGKSGAFIPTIAKLNKDVEIKNTILLFKNSLSAKISVNRRRDGFRFSHSITKDFTFDNNMNLKEEKEVVKIDSDELYYDNPRYQYKITKSVGHTCIRVDNLRDNTGFNVNINGDLTAIDDIKLRKYLWFPDGELHSMLYNILTAITVNGEVTLKLDSVPGFNNIVYIKDKDGNITIKESNKKGNIYFTFENIHEDNTFTKRLTVVCDKRRVNLDIVSTQELDIKNMNKLIDYMYSKYDGIFSIEQCFEKISSISFENPDDNLIHVVLTEEYNGRIMKSRVWSRKYQFDRDYSLPSDSIVLRK